MTDTPSLPSVPSFHDGWLTGIVVGEKSTTLGLRALDGTNYELRLFDVQRFRANDFLEGNIIMHLEVIKGHVSTWTDVDARLAELLPSPHPSAALKYHSAYASWLAAISTKIASGEAALVSLEPSYGCDLIALCSDVQLTALPDR